MRQCRSSRSHLIWLIVCVGIANDIWAQSKAENLLPEKFYVSSFELTLHRVKLGGAEFMKAELPDAGVSADMLKSHAASNTVPFVPVKYLYIGLPVGTVLTLSAKSVSSEIKQGVLLAPFVLGDSSQVTANDVMQWRQSAAYKLSELYPAALAKVERYFFVGTQYVAQVSVAPLQYHAQRRELHWHRLIELQWLTSLTRISDTRVADANTNAIDEDFLKQHLINYEQAKAWRVSLPAQRERSLFQATQAQAITWYDPLQPYIKLLTLKEGLYRVSGRQLAAAGISLSGINPKTLRLIYSGQEVPIRVRGEDDERFDPNDEIEFLGTNNPATPEPVLDEFTGNQVGTITEHRNTYSDTAVYWLTWGRGNGRRLPTRVATPSGSMAANTFTATMHIEQDCVYVTSLTESGQYVTERVVGEGWYQKILQSSAALPIDTVQVFFRLEGVQSSATAQADIRLAHTTPGSGELEIWLNNTPMRTLSLTGRGANIYPISFSASLLRNGTNQFLFRLRRSNAQTSIAIAMVDWLKLTYRQALSLPSGRERQLFFSSEAEQNLEVTDVRESDYALYDMSDTVELVGTARVGTTVRFRADTNKRYLMVERSQAFEPLIGIHQVRATLRSTALGADYIIITHPLFRQQAERLAAFRASAIGGAYRTIVVETEQIYDEFNFGIYHPIAIKRFLNYAFENWQLPRPRYVVLFGGANRDYKGVTWRTNERLPLVPTYGQPVCDVWFTSFSNAPSRPFRNVPRMAIGRIPVHTVAEAETYLQKLIGEGLPFQTQAWHKNFTFINGGLNIAEQQLFRAYANTLISTFVTPAPLAARADTLYRDDQNPFISTQLESAIRATLARGSALVSYIGHAGTNTWDLALGDPLTLQNRGRYPLILSWTCNTGRFAEPATKSFAESFIVSPNGGARCFIGTSGWGFASLDHEMAQMVFAAIRDTLRAVGDIWFTAHRAFSARFPFFNAAIEGTLDHYNIVGDPAEQLPLATLPDVVLEPESIEWLSQPVIASANQRMAVLIKNYGLATRDSVNVRIYDRWANQPEAVLVLDTTLRPIGWQDSLVVSLDFSAQAGLHELTVQLDERNRISEVSKENNRITHRVSVLGGTISSVLPTAFGVASAQQPVLTVLNQSEAPKVMRRYQFELDTTDNFDSPLRHVSGDIIEGLYTTEWRPNIGLLKNTPYFWRVRALDGTDESTWQVFPISFGDELPAQGEAVWQQIGKLLHRNQAEHMKKLANGLTNGDIRLPLIVRSVGFNAQLASLFYEIIVGDDRQFDVVSFGTPPRGSLRGLNIAILDTSRGVSVSRVENFDFLSMFPYTLRNPDTTLPRRFNRLIDGLTNNQIALISLVDAIPDPRDIGMAPIRQRLQQLGSRQIGNLRFRESWAFIGAKNRQVYFEAWGTRCNRAEQIGCDSTREITTIDTAITIRQLRAQLTTDLIGVASRWHSLSWQSSESEAQTQLTVFGVRLDGKEDSLLTTAQRTGISLSAINAQRYPFLRLRATLIENEQTGRAPVLQTLQLRYTLAGDAALSYRTFRAERDSVEAGEPIQLSAEVRNLGAARLDSVPIRLSRIERNGRRQTLQNVLIDSLRPAQARMLSFVVSSSRMLNEQTFILEIDPENRIAELSKQNNRTALTVFVRPDTVRPVAVIEIDGRRITNGELVRQRPRIMIRANDNSRTLTDTNAIRIFLNRRAVFYDQNVLTFMPASATDPTASAIFTPTLTDGDYTLSAIVRDASGNTADSAATTVQFRVETEFKVENLFNYPNPFSDKTEFAFRLTRADDEPPTEFKIFIYTISGRLIQELDVMPVINATWSEYYRVPWDGRDKDGDPLANGVYLYRVVVRSARHTITKTERLAIVR